ncbi:MAG: class I SAM-dependent methyltransferase [Clostridium sp.]|nr:class I SAM-dependent methyltransferase [Clostridium sp.]
MYIGKRLEAIAQMVDKCDTIADIGTDHGYLPIYLIKKGYCKKAVASDINEGPIKKAEKNVKKEKLDDLIQLRFGAGLSTIKKNEVNAVVIAGMGGNLMKNIIEENREIFKNLDFLIAQPVQNPEVFRKYVYESGYTVIDENVVKDEGKYYQILKIKYGNSVCKLKDIYYEVGEKFLHKDNAIVKEYIFYKIEKYDKIFNNIKDDTKLAENRKNQIKQKIRDLQEMIK